MYIHICIIYTYIYIYTYIHIHICVGQDIKPDNFLIGLGKKSTIVYLIDFGLARSSARSMVWSSLA